MLFRFLTEFSFCGYYFFLLFLIGYMLFRYRSKSIPMVLLNRLHKLTIYKTVHATFIDLYQFPFQDYLELYRSDISLSIFLFYNIHIYICIIYNNLNLFSNMIISRRLSR